MEKPWYQRRETLSFFLKHPKPIQYRQSISDDVDSMSCATATQRNVCHGRVFWYAVALFVVSVLMPTCVGAPTNSPTEKPTNTPSDVPSAVPSTAPTDVPSATPTIPCDEPFFYRDSFSLVCEPVGRCNRGEYNAAEPTQITDRVCKICPNATYMTEDNHTHSMCFPMDLCGVGEYMSVDGWASHNRECDACEVGKFMDKSNHTIEECYDASLCNVGERMTYDVTSTTDRVCEACPNATYMSESTHIESECIPMRVCRMGEYMSADGWISRDRQCMPCQPGSFVDIDNHTLGSCFREGTCGVGTYESAPPTLSSDIECTTCDSGKYRLDASHTYTTCIDLTFCGLGQFMVSDGWFNAKRVCSVCTGDTYMDLTAHSQRACLVKRTCPFGEYVVSDGTISTNRICAECTESTQTEIGCFNVSDCTPGQYVTADPTPTTDRTCGNCSEQTFSTRINAVECDTVATCSIGQFMSRIYTTSTDTVCTTCNLSGTYVDNSSHFLTACEEWSVCTSGQFMNDSITAWVDQNRVCEQCADGKYQSQLRHIQTACTPHIDCQSLGVIIAVEGTLTTDRQCSIVEPELNTVEIIGIIVLVGIVVAVGLFLNQRRMREQAADMRLLRNKVLKGLGPHLTFQEWQVGIIMKLQGINGSSVSELRTMSRVKLQNMVSVSMKAILPLLSERPVSPTLHSVKYDDASGYLLLIFEAPSLSEDEKNQIGLKLNNILRESQNRMCCRIQRAVPSTAPWLWKKTLARLCSTKWNTCKLEFYGIGAQQVLPGEIATEIPRQKVIEHAFFAAGRMSQVYRVVVNDPRNGLCNIFLAAKVLRRKYRNAPIERRAFLREAALMAMLDHKNIVKLEGVVTAPTYRDPILLMQLCEPGSLLEYLRSCAANPARLPISVRLGYAEDVCMGLQYLANHRIVHRDVAARNVFLAGDSCRIGDFGMSKTLIGKDEEKYYDRRPPPVRWCAPEVLQFYTYSVESDIWSFGMLLHEMMSFGKEPFGYVESSRVREHIIRGDEYMQRHTENGTEVPQGIYEHLLKPCWNKHPAQRPIHDDLLNQIRQFRTYDNVNDAYVKQLNPALLNAPSVYHLSTTLSECLETVCGEENKPYNRELSVQDMERLVAIPMSRPESCAYVDTLLDKEDSKDIVGQATALLVYSTENSFLEIVDTLQAWCDKTKRDPKATYVWISSLCQNLHKEHPPFDTAQKDFRLRVEAIPYVLPVFEPWNDPKCLKRSWCLFELYTAISMGKRCLIDVLLSPHGLQAFKTSCDRHAEGLSELELRLKDCVQSKDAKAAEDSNALQVVFSKLGGTNDRIDTTVKQFLYAWVSRESDPIRRKKQHDILDISGTQQQSDASSESRSSDPAVGPEEPTNAFDTSFNSTGCITLWRRTRVYPRVTEPAGAAVAPQNANGAIHHFRQYGSLAPSDINHPQTPCRSAESTGVTTRNGGRLMSPSHLGAVNAVPSGNRSDPSIGASDGASVCQVGASVGASEGAPLGASDGASDGASHIASLGASEGISDGASLRMQGQTARPHSDPSRTSRAHPCDARRGHNIATLQDPAIADRRPRRLPPIPSRKVGHLAESMV